MVVNKADRDGAAQTVRDLKFETHVPVLMLVAARAEGWAISSRPSRHITAPTPRPPGGQARAQVLSLAQSRLHAHPELDALAAAVAEGRCDAYSAAESLITGSVVDNR